MALTNTVKKASRFITDARELLDALVSDSSVPVDIRVSRIINATSLLCGIMAAQPLPFADIMILTPIQVGMVYNLAKALGVPLSESGAKEVITTVLGVAGWGMLAQQGVIGLYKMGVPYLGAISTIPIVYAATYAIGCASKAVLEARVTGKTLSKDTIETIRKTAFEEGKKVAKQLTPEAMKQQFADLKRVAEEHKQRVSVLEDQVSVLKNQPLTNSQIQKYFHKALAEARTEINIMSPWVNKYVAESLRDLFTGALSRGVTIKVLYGLRERSDRTKEERYDRSDRAVGEMKRWFRPYNQLFRVMDFAKLHNQSGTHVKLMLCDEQFYLIGSYNFLSFAGDYKSDNREEMAELSRDVSLLKKYRRQYFSF